MIIHVWKKRESFKFNVQSEQIKKVKIVNLHDEWNIIQNAVFVTFLKNFKFNALIKNNKKVAFFVAKLLNKSEWDYCVIRDMTSQTWLRKKIWILVSGRCKGLHFEHLFYYIFFLYLSFIILFLSLFLCFSVFFFSFSFSSQIIIRTV